MPAPPRLSRPDAGLDDDWVYATTEPVYTAPPLPRPHVRPGPPSDIDSPFLGLFADTAPAAPVYSAGDLPADEYPRIVISDPVPLSAEDLLRMPEAARPP